jgi:HAMP domain-containing protein
MSDDGAAPDDSIAGKTTTPSVRGWLFRKYVVLFAAVVGAALLANGMIAIWLSYQEHKALLIRAQHEQAVAAALKIDRFIKDIESQIGLALQLPWSAQTLEERRFDASRLMSQVPAITELARLDPAGREQLRVSRLTVDVVGSGIDRSGDPNFTGAMAAQGSYYGPVYYLLDSEPYMTLALAHKRRDTGVIIAEVNLTYIRDVVSQIKLGENGKAYVVDAQERLIAHPDIGLVLRNTDMSRLAQVKAARIGRPDGLLAQDESAQDLQGGWVMAAHAPIADLGWLVFVELPVEEAYASLYGEITRSVLLLLAAIGLTLLAGTWLARRMVAPIKVLHSGAARIGRGDLGQRISVKTGDELEALADQFYDMAGRLQESYSDLQRKVEIRTAELSRSVERLQALADVSQTVNSTVDLETVLSTIVAKAVQLSETEAGAIYVQDETSQNVRAI